MSPKVAKVNFEKREIPAVYLNGNYFFEERYRSEGATLVHKCRICSVIPAKYFYYMCSEDKDGNNRFCLDCSSAQNFRHKSNCRCRVFRLYDQLLSDNLRFQCFYSGCNASLTFNSFFEHYQRCEFSSSSQPRFQHQPKPTANPRQLRLPSDILRDLNLRENELQSIRSEYERLFTEEKAISEEIACVQKQREQLARKQTDLEKKLELVVEKKQRVRQRITQPSNQEQVDDNCCKVCYNAFDKNLHHQSCIAKCFHTYCFSCLSLVNPKICPHCRKPFRMSDVRKLY